MSELVCKPISNDEKDYILSHFSIDNAGRITRDDRKNSCGSLDAYGYLTLKIKGKQYKAHRIAWLLYYGEYPTNEIDHINRVRTDNRKENLRLSSRKEQNNNSLHEPNAESGFIGVHVDRTTKGLKKKYCTRINKKTYRFYSALDAVAKRKEMGLPT